MASWSVHRELMGYPMRAKQLARHPEWTVRQWREHLNKKGPSYSPPPRSQSEKVEHVKELLADPEVAREVVADRSARTAVTEAVVANSAARREFKEAVDDTERDSRGRAEYVDASYHLAKLVMDVRRVIREVQAAPLDEKRRDDLRESFLSLQAGVEWLGIVINSDGPIDSEIEAFLAEEAK